jgi:hypothetical protein
VSSSYARTSQTASYVLNAISSSYALSSSEATLAQTASYVLNAISASYAPNQLSGGTANYIPIWSSSNTLTSSMLYQSQSRYLYANVSGSPKTFYVDTADNTVQLGQTTLAGFFFEVDGNNNVGGFQNPAGSYYSGLAVNFSDGYYALGDNVGDYNGTAIFIDDSGDNGSLHPSTISINASYTYVLNNLAVGKSTSYPINAILDVDGSAIITGSLIVTQGITGSLFGTASYATTASYALTSSYATNFTASNILVNGTLTAQTIYAQYVTASTEYSTGSNVFGNSLSNTQTFTGSVSITGSLRVNNVPVILSNQTSSMTVATASYVINSVSASYATSASYAQTASYANSNAVNGFGIGGSSIYYSTVNSSIGGANNLFTLSTGSYTSGFFKYTVYSGSNSRSGEVISSWNNGNTQYTDFSTPDNGSTTAVTMSVTIISSQMQFNAQTNTSGWTIKSQLTLI